jgi:hypothetical protein
MDDVLVPFCFFLLFAIRSIETLHDCMHALKILSLLLVVVLLFVMLPGLIRSFEGM